MEGVEAGCYCVDSGSFVSDGGEGEDGRAPGGGEEGREAYPWNVPARTR